ncbi:MAG: hypothetical protein ABI955_14235 [Nitrospirota bacterium]
MARARFGSRNNGSLTSKRWSMEWSPWPFALLACSRGNRIMFAWKGAPGDSGIYFSLFGGQEFTGQIRMSNVGTSVGPTVVDLSGSIALGCLRKAVVLAMGVE